MKKYNILQANPKRKYQGSHYAITGTGGFEINTRKELLIKPIVQFGKYDLTNAIQVVMKKELFNSKIGNFDIDSQTFPVDIIHLETDEFLLAENQIISLGSIETIYLDFKKYVYDYFNMKQVVNLFNETIIDVFDTDELFKMIRDNTFTGYIEIVGINEIMKNLVENNICGNRQQGFERKDGFMNGDLFYFQEGLSIMLSVDCGLRQLYKYDISIRLE